MLAIVLSLVVSPPPPSAVDNYIQPPVVIGKLNDRYDVDTYTIITLDGVKVLGYGSVDHENSFVDEIRVDGERVSRISFRTKMRKLP